MNREETPSAQRESSEIVVPAPTSLEERVLMLAPTGRDAELACRCLGQAGIWCACCADGAALCSAVEAGAATVLLAEEALQPRTVRALAGVLKQQQPWSDLPLIVFAEVADHHRRGMPEAVGPLLNATILERPIRIGTLVSVIRAALRARRRQYQVRDLLRRQAEVDRRKDEFLTRLGHELRNPLAAIRNALFVWGQGAPNGSRLEHQRLVIDRQTRHLALMVDDLLAASRATLASSSVDGERIEMRLALEGRTAEPATPALSGAPVTRRARQNAAMGAAAPAAAGVNRGAAASAPRRDTDPSGKGQDPLHALHVLVVEDNLDGRESLRELLEMWGYNVELAADGHEGLEKALAAPPDVALVDIGLPLLDGNEVARGIRKVLDPERVSLIAMTGYSQPEDQRRALEAGFDAYLVKPLDPTHLELLLGEEARRRRSAAPLRQRSRDKGR